MKVSPDIGIPKKDPKQGRHAWFQENPYESALTTKLAKAPVMLRETSRTNSARWVEMLCSSWNDVRLRSSDEDCNQVEVQRLPAWDSESIMRSL